MAAHSWHPVPLAIHSPLTIGERTEGFTEASLRRGIHRPHRGYPGDDACAGPRGKAEQIRTLDGRPDRPL